MVLNMISLFSEIISVVKNSSSILYDESIINTVFIDSRKVVGVEEALFVAITGESNDGHDFIQDLYAKGVRNFIVERQDAILPEANFIVVKNSIQALQQIASFHRAKFDLPVLAITGSNGKTIVKEWLFQLLQNDFSICKNPGSYNSQVGVPLSVLHLKAENNLALFEAGISECNEMTNLEKVIVPTLGLITNIGDAHNAGFESLEQKLNEKIQLFKKCTTIFYCEDHISIGKVLTGNSTFSWGWNTDANLKICAIKENVIELLFEGKTVFLKLPFVEQPMFENVMHCISVMLYLRFSISKIQERIDVLKAIPMRLEVKEGVSGSLLIDDTYNNDLGGLEKALDFQQMHSQHRQKLLILSDVQQVADDKLALYSAVSALVLKHGVDQFVGIGAELKEFSDLFPDHSIYFNSVKSFFDSDIRQKLSGDCVLIKGARSFEFEKIVSALEKKNHITKFEINLNALEHNYSYFKKKAGTRIMAMVKAFAYGAGNIEVAKLLSYLNVDYLGVAYTDEGVELRDNGIETPIMVMNPDYAAISKMVQYQLEPEVYGFSGLREVINADVNVLIHIKLDTGMRRLGFEFEELPELLSLLKGKTKIKVQSIFSHLAASDVSKCDDFTLAQLSQFEKGYQFLSDQLEYSPLKHILNSAGIQRFQDYAFDMVRLGVGLYGIGVNEVEQTNLLQVGTLKTTVSQVKVVKKGESVGYSRKGITVTDSTIATIAIGYADGFDRRFSNGVGEVLINGKKYPIIGNVCMDMSMVDLGEDQVQEGDEVVVYGPGLPVYEQAKKIGTIPYELLTHVSERVKRVFYQE